MRDALRSCRTTRPGTVETGSESRETVSSNEVARAGPQPKVSSRTAGAPGTRVPVRHPGGGSPVGNATRASARHEACQQRPRAGREEGFRLTTFPGIGASAVRRGTRSGSSGFRNRASGSMGMGPPKFLHVRNAVHVRRDRVQQVGALCGAAVQEMTLVLRGMSGARSRAVFCCMCRPHASACLVRMQAAGGRGGLGYQHGEAREGTRRCPEWAAQPMTPRASGGLGEVAEVARRSYQSSHSPQAGVPGVSRVNEQSFKPSPLSASPLWAQETEPSDPHVRGTSEHWIPGKPLRILRRKTRKRGAFKGAPKWVRGFGGESLTPRRRPSGDVLPSPSPGYIRDRALEAALPPPACTLTPGRVTTGAAVGRASPPGRTEPPCHSPSSPPSPQSNHVSVNTRCAAPLPSRISPRASRGLRRRAPQRPRP